MLSLAIQNTSPGWGYRGSCTENTKEAFDGLVSLDGTKPAWGDIQIEMGRVNTEHEGKVETEALIQQEIRDIAINSLKTKGKLDANGKVTKEN